MFEQIAIYKVNRGAELRVMVRYTSGAVYDRTQPVGNLDPLQVNLPATDKGDPAAVITVDTRQAEAVTNDD